MSTASGATAPRIFCIPARAAPIVAVLRRGPTDWWHVGRWDVGAAVYEPGAWFRGALYPQKCDLSPDGRWLVYSALQARARWPAGTVYEAVSRLPWLTALAAWEAGTTYTTGFHFVDDPGESNAGEPDVGDAGPCFARYGLRINPVVQFRVERRRGWRESADTAPRRERGPWDERRRVEMEKPRPGSGDGPVLHVAGGYAGHRTSPDWYEEGEYWLTAGGDLHVLDDMQWADWDHRGRLLVATAAGRLEIRTVHGAEMSAVWGHDLADLRPDPAPAPAWASQW